MIEQKLRVFLWICLAHLIYYSATTEIPKECVYGTPDYNETLCSETCTKPVNVNESYCSNFTQGTTNTQNQPEQQEAGGPVALSGIMTSTTGEGVNIVVTTPKTVLDGPLVSSAVSVELSLTTSAIASLSVLFFAYF